MAGVLRFDGVDDRFRFTTLASPLRDVSTGAWTVAVLIRRANNVAGGAGFDGVTYLLDAAGTAEQAGFSFGGSGVDNKVYCDDVGGGTSASPSTFTSLTDTYMLVLSKASGSVAPRLGWVNLTAGGAMTHENLGTALPNGGAADIFAVGAWEGADPLDAWVGVVAWWAGEMSDANKAALTTNKRTSDLWSSAHGAPAALVELNVAAGSLVDLAGNASGLATFGGGPTLDGAVTLESWNFDGTGGPALTYPSALPDFQRNVFPFLLGDRHIQGTSRAGVGARRLGRRMGPSPIGGFERYIFPRLHPEFATGGITYDKLGDLIAGMLAAGDDVFEATEAGSLTPDTTTSGADVFEHVESGSLIAGTIFAGADVFTAAETGSLTPAVFLAGVGTKAAEKTGSLIVGVFTAGADTFTAAETGTISTAGQLRGADVFEHNETGSLNPAAQLRGADAFQATEAGSLTPTGFIAGPDASTFNRLGSVTTGALLSGVAAKLGSYLKTGSLTVSVALSGPDVSTFNRLGSITPDTTWAGVRIREKSKDGSVTTAGQLRGADVFTAAETGSLTPATFILGGRNVTLNRTGSITTGVLLAGTSTYVAFLVEPIPAGWISSGRVRVLTRGRQGRIDQPEQGVIT